MRTKISFLSVCLAAVPVLAGDIVRPRLGPDFNRGYRQWVGVGHEKYNGVWFATTWRDSWRLSKIPYQPVVWGNLDRKSDPTAVLCVNSGKNGEIQLSDAVGESVSDEDDMSDLAVDGGADKSEDGVTVKMPGGVGPRKYLYLLNSLVGGTPKFKMDVVFSDRAGKSAAVPLKWGVDVRDWRDLEAKANSFNEHVYKVNPPGKDERRIAPGEVAVASTTVLAVPSGLGEIAKIRFVPKSDQDDGLFLVHDFFLSSERHAPNVRPVEIVRKGRDWRPSAFPLKRGIRAGSPMDRSPKTKRTVAELGRIVSDGRGNFVFEKDPEKKPIRWICGGPNQPIENMDGSRALWQQREVVGKHNEKVRREKDKWAMNPIGVPDWSVPDDRRLQPVAERGDAYRAYLHQEIEAAVENDYRAGYRVRDFYGDASWRFVCAEKGLDFDPDVMDILFYSVKCMEDRGMYLTWNIGMDPSYPGKPWNPEEWPAEQWTSPWGESELAKTNMERCKQAARQLLAAKNPYTGKTIAESDVLVAMDLFGESLFFKNAASHHDDIRRELKKKYGDGEEGLEKIRKAWGKGWDAKWSSIDAIEFRDWLGELSPRGADLVEICRRVGEYRIRYWGDYIRSLGFRGPLTSDLIVNDFLRMQPRAWPNSYTAGNAYHAFPLGQESPFPIMSNWQSSSLAQWCDFYRGFAMGRIQNEPFVIVEGDFPWMNSRRYEQAFGMYALGAMNGFAWMKSFSAGGHAAFHYPDELKRGGVGGLGNFNGLDDPVKWATEFLGWWMQDGGCVKQSDLRFRIDVSMEEVEKNALWNTGISGDESCLALLGRLSVNFVPKGAKPPPVDKTQKEMAFPRTGRGATFALGGVGGMDVNVADILFAKAAITPDGTFNFRGIVEELKRRGWIAKDNRTNPSTKEFESSTGELYMNFGKQLATVDSERMRALFTGGNLENVPGFKVTRLEPYGVAAVVALDGKPVETSGEMMLVFATDAMNDEMVFDSTGRSNAVCGGYGPPLTRAGRLACEIANAGAFTMTSLRPDGSELKDHSDCLKQSGGALAVTLDTSVLDEVTPFYYLKARRRTRPGRTMTSTPDPNAATDTDTSGCSISHRRTFREPDARTCRTSASVPP